MRPGHCPAANHPCAAMCEEPCPKNRRNKRADQQPAPQPLTVDRELAQACEALLLECNERRVAEAQVEELLAALQGVVAVADRATVEFDRARQAIASAVKNRTIGRAVVSENPVSE